VLPDAALPDAAPPDAPAPLTLLAAGATEDPVTAELPIFLTSSGLTVTVTIGSAGALSQQIMAGAKADVALVTPAVITALGTLVLPGSQVDLGKIGGGVAVKTGDTMPAISTADELKQAILAADGLYYADPALATAGKAFQTILKTLLLDTDATVTAKTHLSPGGKDAMLAMAASSDLHPLGVSQLSEILSVPAVTLVGEYPAPLQTTTTYSAIILQSSTRQVDAQKLVTFFTGTEFKARLAASGFTAP